MAFSLGQIYSKLVLDLTEFQGKLAIAAGNVRDMRTHMVKTQKTANQLKGSFNKAAAGASKFGTVGKRAFHKANQFH